MTKILPLPVTKNKFGERVADIDEPKMGVGIMTFNFMEGKIWNNFYGVLVKSEKNIG